MTSSALKTQTYSLRLARISPSPRLRIAREEVAQAVGRAARRVRVPVEKVKATAQEQSICGRDSDASHIDANWPLVIRTTGRSNDEMRVQDDATGRPLRFGQTIQKEACRRDAHIPGRLSNRR
jgi:hypothetical protein